MCESSMASLYSVKETSGEYFEAHTSTIFINVIDCYLKLYRYSEKPKKNLTCLPLVIALTAFFSILQ